VKVSCSELSADCQESEPESSLVMNVSCYESGVISVELV